MHEHKYTYAIHSSFFLCMEMEGAEGEREYVCVHASILNHAKIVDGLQML